MRTGKLIAKYFANKVNDVALRALSLRYVLANDDEGATFFEYVVIIGVVLLIIIAVFAIFGNSISAIIGNIMGKAANSTN